MNKKKFRGSFTIEAAVIVPLILFVFSVLMYILFYYHDKNILLGAAHETVALGSSREENEESDLEAYFRSRINGKLLLFTRVKNEVEIGEEEVTIICKASKNRMLLKLEYAMARTEPEDYIRNIRKIEKFGEGIGEKGENILQK